MMHQPGVVCHTPVFISELHRETDRLMNQVALCGVVVDIIAVVAGSLTRPLVIRLDDGTGCLDCAYFRPDKETIGTSLKLGDAVLITGAVHIYRDQLQLRCEAVRRVTEANFETLWINRVIYVRQLKRTT